MLTNYLPPTRSVSVPPGEAEHCFKRMMEMKCICKTWRDQTCNRKKNIRKKSHGRRHHIATGTLDTQTTFLSILVFQPKSR